MCPTLGIGAWSGSDDFQIQHSTVEFEYLGVGDDYDDQQTIAEH